MAQLKLKRFVRTRLARNRAAKYWMKHRENRHATTIQRRFRMRATQKAVVAMNKAYNRACFRIAMLWSKRKARIRYKAIQRDMEARKEEEALKHKQELMRRKNFRTVKKCFESGRERAAIKVQKNGGRIALKAISELAGARRPARPSILRDSSSPWPRKRRRRRRCTRARCIMGNSSR